MDDISVPSITCRWQPVKEYTAPPDECMVITPTSPNAAMSREDQPCEPVPCVWLWPGETAYSVGDGAALQGTIQVRFRSSACDDPRLLEATQPECQP